MWSVVTVDIFLKPYRPCIWQAQFLWKTCGYCRGETVDIVELVDKYALMLNIFHTVLWEIGFGRDLLRSREELSVGKLLLIKVYLPPPLKVFHRRIIFLTPKIARRYRILSRVSHRVLEKFWGKIWFVENLLITLTSSRPVVIM